MRTGDGKSQLKRTLKVEVSRRLIGLPDTIIVDFSALLYHLQWSNEGKLSDITNTVIYWLLPKLEHSDVFLVCDRYFNKSPKGWPREIRSGDDSEHLFKSSTTLPPRNTCLGVNSNKIQILNHIFEELANALAKHQSIHGRCIITGSTPIPVEIHKGLIIKRRDMEVHHEEADLVMINQMLHAVPQSNQVRIIADDADIFVLAIHHHPQLEL